MSNDREELRKTALGFFDSPLVKAMIVPPPTAPAGPTAEQRAQRALNKALRDAFDGLGSDGGELSLRQTPSAADFVEQDRKEAAAKAEREQVVLERQTQMASLASLESQRKAIGAKLAAAELAKEKEESLAKIEKISTYCRAKGWDPHGPKRSKAFSQMRKAGLLK